MRTWKLSEGHPDIGEKCAICGLAIRAQELVTLAADLPSNPEEHRRMVAGLAYTTEAKLVHVLCLVVE